MNEWVGGECVKPCPRARSGSYWVFSEPLRVSTYFILRNGHTWSGDGKWGDSSTWWHVMGSVLIWFGFRCPHDLTHPVLLFACLSFPQFLKNGLPWSHSWARLAWLICGAGSCRQKSIPWPPLHTLNPRAFLAPGFSDTLLGHPDHSRKERYSFPVLGAGLETERI